MAHPIPVILCGKTEQIGRGVIEGLKPECEVVHFILTPEAGIAEIPLLLRGVLPNEMGSTIGSGNLKSRIKAIVLGGAYDDDAVARMHDAASQVASVAWVKQDTSIPTPPLGPEYGKAMVARVKTSLSKLQADGDLDNVNGRTFLY